ncbi:hypothetical protein D3C72_1725060 [compost metagenome]
MQQQQREFVAAQPPDRIGFPHILQQQVRDPHQGGVAGGVAQPVVDALEPVQIEIEQHRLNVVTATEGHAAVQHRHEAAPVQRPRQNVVVRQSLRRLGARGQGRDLGAQPFDLGVQIHLCGRDGQWAQVRLRRRESRPTPALAASGILATLVAGATRVL